MSEFERKIEKFKKCMSEECFRWAIAVCMDIKREYWHYYSVCLAERETKPELSEDQCHERSMGEILRKYDFSKDAIKECLIS
jgi:hypothetical protein